jgi:hypothetical protein
MIECLLIAVVITALLIIYEQKTLRLTIYLAIFSLFLTACFILTYTTIIRIRGIRGQSAVIR